MYLYILSSPYPDIDYEMYYAFLVRAEDGSQARELVAERLEGNYQDDPVFWKEKGELECIGKTFTEEGEDTVAKILMDSNRGA